MSLISRREALKRGSMIAVGLVAPRWLSTIARADIIKRAAGTKAADTVLVVCQLSGGNDGLNTVIPWSTKAYRDLRPTIGIPEDKILKIDNSLGFHPSMQSLKTLWTEKKVAVIQGVGYPRPNRSHFKSMEIWQSASPDGKLKYGWIGRHLDMQQSVSASNPIVALGLSKEKPLALTAHDASIPCFASLADIENMVGDPDSERLLRLIQGQQAGPGDQERVVQQANGTALDAMAMLSAQLKTYVPKQAYGSDEFGAGFRQIAQLVASSPQTRVVYFSAGGFDTHARQEERHEQLLGGFSDAVLAFQREMEAIGKAKNVVVLVFSEFGRRAYENASGGTDHGKAAPMFLIGSAVKGGLYGSMPDLNALDDGDIKFGIDFREVYATTLDQWMGSDSGVILGDKFTHVEALGKPS